MFGSRTVAQRDVEFNVNLGSFRAQLGEADQLYQRTTGGMSDAALRLSIKQYELTKAVQTYGNESVQAARKAVALRDEMTRLTAASEQNAISLTSEERALGRFSRGTLAAAGVSGELRRALLLGSSAFLGGYGFVAGLNAAIKAAEGEQVAIGHLQVALGNAGISWRQYGAQVEDAIAKQVKSTAFNREDLANALSANVTRFGDLNQALKANAIDADVARAKGISLSDAQKLIQAASLSQKRALTSLGIEFQTTTKNADALRDSTKYATSQQKAAAKAADDQANQLAALGAVEAKYHGNAQRFLQTTAGKQALFSAELKQSEEIIGQALLPTFNRLITRFSDYLDKLNRTGELQKDVNKVVKDAGTFFGDMETAVHGVETLLSPLNRLLGGTSNSIHVLVDALIAFKLKGALSFAQGAKEIGDSAVVAAAEVNGLAAAEKRASASPILGPNGFPLPIPNSGGGSVFTKQFGQVGPGLNPGVIGAGVRGFILSGFVIGDSGESGSVQKTHGTVLGQKISATVSSLPGKNNGGLISYTDPITGKTNVVRLSGVVSTETVGNAIEADIKKRYPTLSTKGALGGPARPGIDRPGTFAPPGTSRSKTPTTQPQPQLILGLTNAQQTPLLQAEGTPGTADDLSALRSQLSILQKLVKQRGLDAQQLNDLLSQRNAVQDQITAILEQNTSKAKTAADKAKAAAKKLADERKKAAHERAKAYLALITHDESGLKAAVEKAKLTPSNADDIAAAKKLEAFFKKEANDPKLTRALRDAFKAKDLAERVAIKKLQNTVGANDKANINEFLSAFQSILGLSSNVGDNPVTRAGKTVIVNQHFPHPPTKDGYREAISAYHANRAVFDG